MAPPYISGIQQVGLGVTDVASAWQWYRRVLGFDVPVFDDYSEARLMTRYTGGQVHSRRALMALNMAGGGGLEIWQFTSRTPQSCSFEPAPGDLGLYAIRFKAPDARRAYEWVGQQPLAQVGTFGALPEGEGFWARDPFGNVFQVTGDSSWFHKNGQPTGA
jgi:catechol 2,3-dioxygenase-like lactoylglutathione lyase family enzyme